MVKFSSLIRSLGRRLFRRKTEDTDEGDVDTPATEETELSVLTSPSAASSTGDIAFGPDIRLPRRVIRDKEAHQRRKDYHRFMYEQPSKRARSSKRAEPSSSRVGVEDFFLGSEGSQSSLSLGESAPQSPQGLPVVYEEPSAEAGPSRNRVESTPPPSRQPRKKVRFRQPQAEAGPSRSRPSSYRSPPRQAEAGSSRSPPPAYRPPPTQWDQSIQTGFRQSSTNDAELFSQPHPGQRLLQPRQLEFLSLNAIVHEVYIAEMYVNPLLWTEDKQLRAIDCTILDETTSRQVPNNTRWERNTMGYSRYRNPWVNVAASPLLAATRVINQLNEGTTSSCWYLVPALLRGFGLWPAAFRSIMPYRYRGAEILNIPVHNTYN
ncbi:hypothetical protein BHE90_011620 [Fusarium euwallaceae]|uniref:Uncharacterized protein n=1 Tax=Fusarium euwallaceae TaxID=1147111 RepID=A0A430LE28_9HYPO|nr:hypothetical protein BHE90_011620 [Fusarium euwallaceae]